MAMLAAPPAAHRGEISGRVKHSKTGEPLPSALVVLWCACLEAPRETQTDANGVYAFTGLPAGTYTVQVLVGMADVSKVITLPPAAAEPEQDQ